MATITLNVLLVEDDIPQVQLYKDTADNYKHDNDIEIVFNVQNNLSDAMKIIQMQHFDAAILDLKLRADSEVKEGNEIAKAIIENLRFPVFVVSGFNDLDESLSTQKNLFFKFYLKEKDIGELFNEIVDIHRTGITDLLNKRGGIDKILTSIFRSHIVNSMPYWIEKSKTLSISNDLLRYTLSHLYEYLEASEQGILHTFHTPEFYIKSPIKTHIKTVFTGDIVKKISDNSLYVVMTPVCDLAVDEKRTIPNADLITLVKIESESFLSEKGITSNKLAQYKNNQKFSYHYLPKSEHIFEGGFLNFQSLVSVPLSDITDKSKYIVELAISGAFRKDITARFANYYGRQGQPVLIP